MKLTDYQAIFASNVALLIQHIEDMGYRCTLGEAWRTKEMAEIYAKKGIGIKDSLHIKRLAIDINLFKDGVFLEDGEAHKQFGEWWEKLHPFNRWGGRFSDGNHYEMREAIQI